MDAFRECLAPDVILRLPEGWPEPGPFVGQEAVMQQFQQARDLWDSDILEPIRDFIGAADRVVLRYIWHGVGKGRPDSNMAVTCV
jgi:hypothetical protein